MIVLTHFVCVFVLFWMRNISKQLKIVMEYAATARMIGLDQR